MGSGTGCPGDDSCFGVTPNTPRSIPRSSGWCGAQSFNGEWLSTQAGCGNANPSLKHLDEGRENILGGRVSPPLCGVSIALPGSKARFSCPSAAQALAQGAAGAAGLCSAGTGCWGSSFFALLALITRWDLVLLPQPSSAGGGLPRPPCPLAGVTPSPQLWGCHWGRARSCCLELLSIQWHHLPNAHGFNSFLIDPVITKFV